MNTKELIEHCQTSIKLCFQQANLADNPETKQRWDKLREGWEFALYEAENPERMNFFKNTHEILRKYERPVKKYPDGIGILTADFNELISDMFKYIKENEKSNK